jgi:hypothetical protein
MAGRIWGVFIQLGMVYIVTPDFDPAVKEQNQ